VARRSDFLFFSSLFFAKAIPILSIEGLFARMRAEHIGFCEKLESDPRAGDGLFWKPLNCQGKYQISNGL
jgi:hypothetical protein